MKIEFILATLICCILIPPAFAVRDVSSPTVSEGLLRLESRFGYLTEDGTLQQRYLADYGLNDWYAMRLAARYSWAESSHNDFTTMEWEHRLQLLEKANDGWDGAVRFHFNHTQNADKADGLGMDLLSQFDAAGWIHTANINFDWDIGGHRESGTAMGLAWKSQTEVMPNLLLGAEWYGDLGRLNEQQGMSEHHHHIGPVLTYALNDTIGIETGYLIGITEPATDGLLKFHIRGNF